MTNKLNLGNAVEQSKNGFSLNKEAPTPAD